MCCLDGISGWICGAQPYQENSQAGDITTVTKTLIVGLLIIAAASVGFYYFNMWQNTWWNPFDISVETQMGLSIAASCVVGITATVVTGLYLSVPIKRLQERAASS